jgi:HAD superfamily hydrolase (TIGR01549 family)
MANKQEIAFVDFDKTIYDLQIPLFEDNRKELAKNVEEKFGIIDSFYPILENIQKISLLNPEIRKYAYGYIDEIEHKAGGYFYSYAESLLKKVSGKMPVLIVSNNSSQVIAQRLKDGNLYNYVKYVYGRDSADYFKPTGEVLAFCCEQLSILPKSISKFIYIGDSWRDYKCAADFAAKNNLNYTFLHPNSLPDNEMI